MSQVNFFMLPEDEDQFVSFLAARSDTHILIGRSFSSPEPQPVRELPPASETSHVTLLNAKIRPTPSCRPSASGASGGAYMFELMRDPFIEFSRSSLCDDLLLPGRIFAKIGWLDSQEGNRQFKLWYSAIERWLKKRYQKYRDHWWFGPEAEKWSLAGGLVAYGPFPSGALVESLQSPKDL